MILYGQIAAIRLGSEGYPRCLLNELNTHAPAELKVAGPSDLLNHPKIGFFCSSQCPGSVVLKTFDAITRMRDEGQILVGGFHSVMEWECFRILLRGMQPIIWVPARSIAGMRLKPELKPAFESDRLLILSPFEPVQQRTTATLAERRNRFIGALVDRFFIPYASPGGKTAALASQLLTEGKQVCTVEDPSNAGLILLGATQLNPIEIPNRRVRHSVSC